MRNLLSVCISDGRKGRNSGLVVASEKRHRIEPWTYLCELLLRLHDDDPRLDEMLPDRWAIQHPEAVLTYRLEESRRKAATRKNQRLHRSANR